MSWIGRLARTLGVNLAEPVSLVALRRFSDELTAAAAALRATAQRAVLLQLRTEELVGEGQSWERRLERARRTGDPELIEAAARMAGRVLGQLEVAREELAVCLADEAELHAVLVEERRRWMRLVEEADRMGLNTSGCLLHLDLTRPPPPADAGLPDDEEREFVARLIDRSSLN